MESAKRPLDSSAAAASASASGEISFRILCPSDKTGDVIGKGGAIISKIREDTRSKIPIDDPVAGSDDRVILITADSNPKDHADVSSAQTALVRVFERIEGPEEGKEASCRLLVGASQVGCVLGKGGKIVEWIRVESGAQVRVLGKDQLPGCAAAGMS